MECEWCSGEEDVQEHTDVFGNQLVMCKKCREDIIKEDNQKEEGNGI